MSRIRIFDLETTGLEPTAEVVEWAYTDLVGDASGWSIDARDSGLCGVSEIPPSARAIHHIRLHDVDDLPPFDPIVLRSPEVDVFAAHFAKFDRQFFDPQGPMICTYKAALRVWPDAPGHSNHVLRYWLEDQGKLSIDPAWVENPHRAGPDTYVTAHILMALLDEATGAEMVRWNKEPPLHPTCPIGKHKGKPWAQIDAGFLNWMLKQAGMDPDLQWNAQRELDLRQGVAR